jgi:dolichol-phosphate mannosyltransferase
MTDDVATVRVPVHHRVRRGLRKPANWFALLRFAIVGASGYVVNLVVYSVLVHGAGANYLVAATVAFLVAVTNNFWWNRGWTFRAHGGHAGFQAARFFVVSAIAVVISLVLLRLLVGEAGLPKVAAQAIAVAAVTPLNFAGNKLWSFSQR